MDDRIARYTEAASVPSLAAERAARLVEHVASLPEPASLEVVRLTAALMAAQERLSSPTALAQARAVARLPQLGDALLEVQRGLMALGDCTGEGLLDGLQREAAHRLVLHLVAEATSLAGRLQAGH
jgi:hypothetical protein